MAEDYTEYKQLIFKYAQEANSSSPLYHYQQDSKYIPCNYYCSLIVCGRSFSSQYAYGTKSEAEHEVDKQACLELNLLNLPQSNNFNQTDPYSTQSGMMSYMEHKNVSTNQTPGYDRIFAEDQMVMFPNNSQPISNVNKTQNSNFHVVERGATNALLPNLYNSFIPAGSRANVTAQQPVGKREWNNSFKKDNNDKPPKLQKSMFHSLSNSETKTPIGQSTNEPIPVSTAEDVWKYLTDNVLASSFKSFLHGFAQHEKCTHPKYEVFSACENGITGFRGKVSFKDREFNSLGKIFVVLL